MTGRRVFDSRGRYIAGGSRNTVLNRVKARPYYASSRLKLLQDFDTLADLTIGGSPSVSEIVTDRVTVGNGSYKVTAGGATATIDFDLDSIAFSGADWVDLLLRWWTADTGFTSCTLYLSTTTNFSAGTWASAAANNYGGYQDQATLQSGWNNRRLARADFTGGTPTLLDDAANVFIKARVSVTTGRGPVTFDGLWLNQYGRPVFIFCFDDGSLDLIKVNESVFGTGRSAFSYMHSLGVPGACYIVSSLIGDSDRLSADDIKMIHDSGWDICPHTVTHTDLTTLTHAEIVEEVIPCRDALKAIGVVRGLEHFAYPSGEFTLDDTPAFIASLGFETARSIETSTINPHIAPPDIFNWWARGVGTGILASDITARIDDAISHGWMAAMYVHGLDAVETTLKWDPSKLKTVIDYAVTQRDAGLLDIMTPSDYYDGLNLNGGEYLEYR